MHEEFVLLIYLGIICVAVEKKGYRFSEHNSRHSLWFSHL